MRKDFSIPLIDLSKETFRQFQVDREPGLYIGHPTSVLLEDGQTIVTVYPKSHGIGQITLKKSHDGGKTWSDRLPVPDSWGTSMEVPTIFRTVEKDGTKHLLVFSGVNPIRMAHSEDDGDTWSELEPIGKFAGVVALSTMICYAPGCYKAYYHYYSEDSYVHELTRKLACWATGTGLERRTKLMTYYRQADGSWGEAEKHWVKSEDRDGDDWHEIYAQYLNFGPMDPKVEPWVIFEITSTDGGMTWGEPRPVQAQRDGLQICEPCVIASPDGSEWAMIMRENSRKANSQICFSKDQGKTWSELYELPGALTGDRHNAKYLKDGRLFISFRDMPLEKTKDYPSWGWAGWVGTYDDLKNQREGQYRVLLMLGDCCDCGYPGVEVLPDGTVATITYGHWIKDEQPFVMCVRVHPDELDAHEKLNV